MRNLFSLLLILLSIKSSIAQNATWNGGVGQLIYNNCSNCHHDGGIGPFSLLSYDDAKDRALSIRSHTQDGHMPPWKPDPTYRHFVGERKLSDAQIQLIADWVDNGTPIGTGNSPTPPTIKIGSQLNRIDQTGNFPKYTVINTVDDYRTFVIPTSHTSLKYINAIEFLPSNASIVHHIILYHDPSSHSRNLDSLDPGPGYASNGTGAESPNAKLIGLWTPGAGIFYLPDNMGYELPVGTDLVMEVHYAPNSNAKSDSTTVNIKYTSSSPVRIIKMELPLYHFPPVLQSPALIIPANTTKDFLQRTTSGSQDISLVGIFPHMHLIGKSYTIYTTKGTDTTKLIRIPDWDFHWQGFYTFQKLLKIPQQSFIWGRASYDNTSSNPQNPSNPPITVSAGENTKDEMMVAFIAYTTYQVGDENIILDSALLNTGVSNITKTPITIYPNPANNKIFINADEEIIKVKLYQYDGRLMRIFSNTNELNIEFLNDGLYFVEVETTLTKYRQKILIKK